MKRILLAFTLILLTASVTSAQQKEASLSVVGDAIYDFGEINETSGAVTHVFTIKNEGETPLVITRASASCGCTTPEITREPIATGKTGEIKVTFDPTGRPGPFTKPVTVFSNGTNGSFMLTIKGIVIPKS